MNQGGSGQTVWGKRMVSVAADYAFSAPRRLVEYIWCLFIEPNAFLRRCERMDRRARCWVFRYCFTLYRDHQSNAFLYSLSRSVVLFCLVRVTSEITYSILIDCICILILIPTLRSGSPRLLQFDGPGRHHTASIPSHKHLSPQEFFLSFLGSSCSLWCCFFVALDTSAILKYLPLSIITALAPPGCSRAASRKHAVLPEKTDGQADGDHDVLVYGDCVVWL